MLQWCGKYSDKHMRLQISGADALLCLNFVREP